jgi:hypothetical protein
MFVMPRTKHIASRIFDFPDPFNPCESSTAFNKSKGMYCYCVEGRIPFVYCGADSITLESIDNQLIDLHRDGQQHKEQVSSLEFVRMFTLVFTRFGRD